MCQWERQLQSINSTMYEARIAYSMHASPWIGDITWCQKRKCIWNFSISITIWDTSKFKEKHCDAFIFCCLLPFNETTMTHELVFFLLLCSSQQFSQISQISIARELLLISLSFRVNHSPRVAASVTSTLFAFCFCPPKINVLRSIQCTKNK